MFVAVGVARMVHPGQDCEVFVAMLILVQQRRFRSAKVKRSRDVNDGSR